MGEQSGAKNLDQLPNLYTTHHPHVDLVHLGIINSLPSFLSNI